MTRIDRVWTLRVTLVVCVLSRAAVRGSVRVTELVQPIAFGVSFLQSQISMDYPVFRSLLPRSVEKRPTRLGLEIAIKIK